MFGWLPAVFGLASLGFIAASQSSASLIPNDELLGVAVTSASNAWAVGFYEDNATGGRKRPLILHWDGSKWARQTVPIVGPGDNDVVAITATSATSAWAVVGGDTGSQGILHWNGTRWAVQASPRPRGGRTLLSVTATSARNAWAVGLAQGVSCHDGLIEHWNGSRWTIESKPKSYATDAVGALSRRSAWAIGCGAHLQPAIAHWNGRFWALSPSPRMGSRAVLEGIIAASPSSAWAVGDAGKPGVIEHWDGSAWKVQLRSTVGDHSILFGADATSPSDAWAVGDYETYYAGGPLIFHWDGSAWKRVSSPQLVGGLAAVAATSPTSAWAVGSMQSTNGTRTLVEHWNGTKWTVVPSPNRL